MDSLALPQLSASPSRADRHKLRSPPLSHEVVPQHPLQWDRAARADGGRQAEAPADRVLQPERRFERPELANPAVTLASDQHFHDWRTESLQASALQDLCNAMHHSLQHQQRASGQTVQKHHRQLSRLQQRHDEECQRAHTEAHRAKDSEARRSDLSRQLDAALGREQAAARREAELTRRLQAAEAAAATVGPLLRKLEATEREASQSAQLTKLEHQGEVQAAKQAAAHWRTAAERARARGASLGMHLDAARVAVEHMLSQLATARRLEELGGLSSALFEAKGHMLAAAEDLAAMERPEDAGTGGAQASPGGRPRAAARPAPSAKWTGHDSGPWQKF
eukprot:Transcript_11017.p1 GENE.Transcript_11017~~Transcript_11017.p1  ORF type:complete len:337 (+),score=98.88 Transcript_11017:304-1314(+)